MPNPRSRLFWLLLAMRADQYEGKDLEWEYQGNHAEHRGFCRKDKRIRGKTY